MAVSRNFVWYSSSTSSVSGFVKNRHKKETVLLMLCYAMVSSSLTRQFFCSETKLTFHQILNGSV